MTYHPTGPAAIHQVLAAFYRASEENPATGIPTSGFKVFADPGKPDVCEVRWIWDGGGEDLRVLALEDIEAFLKRAGYTAEVVNGGLWVGAPASEEQADPGAATKTED